MSIDLQYEWLHEIQIETSAGRILRLHLSELNKGYRVYGEFYDTKEWYLVGFDSKRVADVKALFEGCLRDFTAAITAKGDQIARVNNPCNDPFVTVAEQQAILAKLNISASVTKN